MQPILFNFAWISLSYTVLKKCYDNVKLSLKKPLFAFFLLIFRARISLKPTFLSLSVNLKSGGVRIT